LKTFNKEIADEVRANAAKVGGPFEGNELLLLTTTGAKSGEPRVAPLSCKRIDGKFADHRRLRRRGHQPGVGAQPVG
jgi:hypothetical protein